MEIQGTLLKKSLIQEKTEKFKIQEFYLDCSRFDQYTGDKYENIIKFQVVNNNIEKLHPIKEGDIIKVYYVINGRFFEHNGERKHAQNLTAYNFENVFKETKEQVQPLPIQEEDDGLPF